MAKGTKKLAKSTFTEFLSDFNVKYGKKFDLALRTGDQIPDYRPLATGFPNVDIENLGCGGLPIGAFTMVLGAETVGKTSFYLSTISHNINVLKNKDFKAAIVETEHSMVKKHLKLYNVSSKSVFITNPRSSEEAFMVCTELVHSGHFDLVVLDSIAALISEKEHDIDVGEYTTRGIIAQQLGLFIRQNQKVLRKKDKTAFLFIQQERDNMNPANKYDNKPSINGGRALRFHCAAILWFKYYRKIKDTEHPAGGKDIKVISMKAKTGDTHEGTQTILTQYHKQGFQVHLAHFEYLLKRKKIVKKGSMYKFKDETIYEKKFYKKNFDAVYPLVIKKLAKLYEKMSPASKKLTYSGEEEIDESILEF